MTTNDFIGNFFIFLKNIYIPLPLKVIKKYSKLKTYKRNERVDRPTVTIHLIHSQLWRIATKKSIEYDDEKTVIKLRKLKIL